MNFEGQRSGEEVLCVFRRHIITAFKGVFFFIAMVGVGLVPMLIWRGDSRMFLVWLAFCIVGLGGMVYSYILWYFSFYLLTTERLRQVRQKFVNPCLKAKFPPVTDVCIRWIRWSAAQAASRSVRMPAPRRILFSR